MKKGPLTPKQKKVLDYIQVYQKTRGYGPSQLEIAGAFGFRSLGTVQNYLVRLERHGFLRRPWNAKRALEVVGLEPTGVEVPLLGYVAAGRPIEAVAAPDTLEIPSWMVRGGETFVLQVKGDSMIGDGILEGDYLVVRRQPEPSTGQTVVALVNGEATVKRFRRSGERVELHPSNPAMEPIVIEKGQAFEVHGVVAGVIRRCE